MGPVELIVQHICMDHPLFIESGRLKCKRVPVSDPVNERKESVEVNMAFTWYKDLQVAPVHISAAVIIDMISKAV